MTVASSSPPSRLRPRRAEGATSKLKIRKAREAGDDGALAAVFIAPALSGFLVFLLWPTLRGIYLSFTRFNLLTPAQWVGLDNYDRMIRDPVFWHSPAVTVEYVVINIGVQTAAALAIAVLLQRLTRSAVPRGIVLTPYLMSNVVVGLPGAPADGGHPHRHPGRPDLHHVLERLLLAADGVVQRQLTCPHRGAGHLQGTDPADRHRLGRAHGGDPHRRAPDAGPLRYDAPVSGLDEANSQINFLLNR